MISLFYRFKSLISLKAYGIYCNNFFYLIMGLLRFCASQTNGIIIKKLVFQMTIRNVDKPVEKFIADTIMQKPPTLRVHIKKKY